ncbi:hypothetical protein E4L96_11120 [Massilia arenosa]|uniref:Tetratricopeptide repeat protein n=1 Tax=Zemynaea arenosa TaxID=2561931 RepID=A0A4Y9SC18_9BURK|nr:hypothetical protein [Massilia arenosa]TFW19813.1 hypothetical protein E4L96_11120 [Massilia arenosa]
MSKVLVTLMLAAALAASGCALPEPGRGTSFQRYTPTDPVAFERDIQEVRTEAAQLRAQGKPHDALRAIAELGGLLVSARREQEARALLEQTLREARAAGARDAEGWSMLYLATANQYLDASTDAAHQFDETLRLAAALQDAELTHYAYHHRGRLRAETGDLAGARADFDRALAIRIRLGDETRANSTRRALLALEAWPAETAGR